MIQNILLQEKILTSETLPFPPFMKYVRLLILWSNYFRNIQTFCIKLRVYKMQMLKFYSNFINSLSLHLSD